MGCSSLILTRQIIQTMICVFEASLEQFALKLVGRYSKLIRMHFNHKNIICDNKTAFVIKRLLQSASTKNNWRENVLFDINRIHYVFQTNTYGSPSWR